jgi:hypothetical protein
LDAVRVLFNPGAPEVVVDALSGLRPGSAEEEADEDGKGRLVVVVVDVDAESGRRPAVAVEAAREVGTNPVELPGLEFEAEVPGRTVVEELIIGRLVPSGAGRRSRRGLTSSS